MRQRRRPPAAERSRRRRGWLRALREVHFLLRKSVEGRFGLVEVLCQECFRCVAHPVGDAERAELGEVAIVENQNEMRRLVAEAFEHVAVTAREIPNVARLEIVSLGIAAGPEDRGPHPARDHERPFGRRCVPMQFAHPPGRAASILQRSPWKLAVAGRSLPWPSSCR